MKAVEILSLLIFFLTLFFGLVLVGVVDNSLQHASGVLLLFVFGFFSIAGVLQAYFNKLGNMIQIEFFEEDGDKKDDE